ncbi:hypothetical protein DFH07DRAFT_391194 [Mycena maculata]|uniref:Uncharacterized protein n=1 Tax=Mycena maculata TaxID=230809 RepID=A0AAD7NZM0_9AGAR|nr:hypothetical protein DFH07DRAFT_391194 [Mycena maculata]
MAPNATEQSFMRTEVLAHIATSDYKPCSLPRLREPPNWPEGFSETTAEDGPQSTPALSHSGFIQIGRATLQQIILLYALKQVYDQPVGFLKAVQDTVTSEPVLQADLKKLDPRFLNEVPKVENGCYAYFGALWIQFNKDTERLAVDLRPIFKHLVLVAGDAHIEFGSRYPGKDPSTASNRKRTLPSGASSSS